MTSAGRILHKQPMIDLVANLATNMQAYEPHYKPAGRQVDELAQLLAWHTNSAVRRLPPTAALQARVATHAGCFTHRLSCAHLSLVLLLAWAVCSLHQQAVGGAPSLSCLS